MSKSTFSRFLRDTTAATAIEYSLIAALISIVIFVSVVTIGPKLSSTFTNASNSM